MRPSDNNGFPCHRSSSIPNRKPANANAFRFNYILGVFPWAISERIKETVIRMPRMQACPFMIRGSNDSVGDGLLAPASDTLFASGTFSGGQAVLNFSQPEPVGTSTRTYFVACDLSNTAPAGDSVGASVNGPSSILLAAPNTVAAAGFPLQSGQVSITPTEVGVQAAFQDLAPASVLQGTTNQLFMSLALNTTADAVLWNGLTVQTSGTAGDSDVAALRIYYDSVGSGVFQPSQDAQIAYAVNPFLNHSASLSLAQAQTISTAPKKYFLVLDLAFNANYTATIGLTIPSAASPAVPSPNYVVNSGFPMNSSLAPITKAADTMMTLFTPLLSTDNIGGVETPAFKVQVWALRQGVTFNNLKIARLGSLPDAQIDAARVYKDVDGDAVFESTEVQIGTGTFSSGSAVIAFSSAQFVGLATSTFFVTLQPDVAATGGATFGAMISDPTYFGLTAPDSAGGALPFQTTVVHVIDARTPATPAVTFPDGAATASFDSIHFAWTSALALGSLTTAQYWIGTTPGASDLVAPTVIPGSQRDVKVGGLVLLSGTSYFVSLQATSSFGFTSRLQSNSAVLVDFTQPGQTTLSPPVVGANDIIMTWPTPSAGPSGIEGYLVEYQRVGDPEWYNAKTLGAASQGLAVENVPARIAPRGAAHWQDPAGASVGTAASPQGSSARTFYALDLFAGNANQLAKGSPFTAQNLQAGTLLLQLRAVSGAGVLGAPSAQVRVQFGALPSSGVSNISAFPNPFDSRKTQATITYSLSSASDIQLQIYDAFGRTVKRLSFPGGSPGGQAGANTVVWDGSDDGGRKVSMGVYVCTIRGGAANAVLKIAVIH